MSSYDIELEHLARLVERDMELDPPAPMDVDPPAPACLAICADPEKERHRASFAARSLAIRRARRRPARQGATRPTAILGPTDRRPTRPVRPSTTAARPAATVSPAIDRSPPRVRYSVPIAVPLRVLPAPPPAATPIQTTEAPPPFEAKVMAWLSGLPTAIDVAAAAATAAADKRLAGPTPAAHLAARTTAAADEPIPAELPVFGPPLPPPIMVQYAPGEHAPVPYFAATISRRFKLRTQDGRRYKLRFNEAGSLIESRPF